MEDSKKGIYMTQEMIEIYKIRGEASRESEHQTSIAEFRNEIDSD